MRRPPLLYVPLVEEPVIESPISQLTSPPSVVVAGVICLDLVLELPADPGRHALDPGSLEIVGPAALAVGGCVGNTGIALHRLGLPTTLVARIGDDRFGEILGDLVRAAVPDSSARLLVTPGASTSHSVIHNRVGEDRAIQHFPGANGIFAAADVPADLLDGATLIHLGYPPLMAALVADGGRELERLLATARSRGAMTSVDMASATASGDGRRIDWPAFLRRVLPAVDVFLPSLDEACHVLGRDVDRDARGAPDLAGVGRLADEMIDRGVAIAGVKLGAHGLYVRTAAAARIGVASGRLPAAWANRELYSPAFEAGVVGTTGAGDATIAGFLFGLLTGMTPDETLTAACAVGGASTEAPDGSSGIPAWSEIERRLRGGWGRRANTAPGSGWLMSPEAGVWLGPGDGISPG